MRYIALFEARIHIVKYLRWLQNKGVDGTVQSAPRVLSSNCVEAVCFNYDWNIQDLVNQEVSRIYRVEVNNNYKQVYPRWPKHRDAVR